MSTPQERVQARFSVPMPWAEETGPTVHEVTDWFLELPHAEQIDWMDTALGCLSTSNKCLMYDHEGLIPHLRAQVLNLQDQLAAAKAYGPFPGRLI